MKSELNEHEVKALKILARDFEGDYILGAWFNACCEHLKSLGYVTNIPYVITAKGKELLDELSTIVSPSTDPLAGLVRYEFDRESGSSFWAADKSERAPNGEYVLYTEAAKIVAAERSEKHRAQEAVLKLERVLAQIKAQDPIGYVSKFTITAMRHQPDAAVISICAFVDDDHTAPLYAAPVSDSLKAEQDND